jgi:hypothetical protein
VQRAVSKADWLVEDRPDLRIVDDALWASVQRRRLESEQSAGHRQPGRNLLRGRPAHLGRSLFAGFLFCGACGKSMGVVSARVVKGKGYRYLGCSNAARNGDAACTNRVTTPAAIAEQALLAGLQAEVSSPTTVTLIADQATAAIRARLDERPRRRELLEQQRDDAQAKVRHLLAAVEQGSGSPTLLQALREREDEVARHVAELAALEDAPADRRLAVMPTWVRQELQSLATLLASEPARMRLELTRLGVRFTLHAQHEEGLPPYYKAEGEGDFMALTGFPAPDASMARAAGGRKVRFEINLPPSMSRRRA